MAHQQANESQSQPMTSETDSPLSRAEHAVKERVLLVSAVSAYVALFQWMYEY